MLLAGVTTLGTVATVIDGGSTYEAADDQDEEDTFPWTDAATWSPNDEHDELARDQLDELLRQGALGVSALASGIDLQEVREGFPDDEYLLLLSYRYHGSRDRLGIPQADLVFLGGGQADLDRGDRVAEFFGEQFAERFRHGGLGVAAFEPVPDAGGVGVQVHPASLRPLVHPLRQLLAGPPGPRVHPRHLEIAHPLGHPVLPSAADA